MKLIRLVYASVALTGDSYGALTAILHSAEAHNAAQGITGMLCYGNGAFLQALEGDRTSVNRLYNRIITDPRHAHCTILRYGPVTSRHFEAWSMKLVGLDDPATEGRRELVLKHSGSPQFSPLEMGGIQAVALLDALAARERRAAA